MNQFNSQLKKSLLSPNKNRYIATRKEQEILERVSMSPKNKQIRNNNRGNARGMSLNEGGILPIISVGSSINSVEYRDQKVTDVSSDLNLFSQESKPIKPKRLRIGERLIRDTLSVPTSLTSGVFSPNSASRHSIAIQSSQGQESSRNNLNHYTLANNSPNMRGISPLIREQIRNSNSGHSGVGVFMTAEPQSPKTSMRFTSNIDSARSISGARPNPSYLVQKQAIGK